MLVSLWLSHFGGWGFSSPFWSYLPPLSSRRSRKRWEDPRLGNLLEVVESPRTPSGLPQTTWLTPVIHTQVFINLHRNLLEKKKLRLRLAQQYTPSRPAQQ